MVSKTQNIRKYVTILFKNNKKNKAIEQDILIGNYFKLVKHCEGIETEELYFVHRTIYEYFVAETIFSSINKSVNQSKRVLQAFLGSCLNGEIFHPIYLNI